MAYLILLVYGTFMLYALKLDGVKAIKLLITVCFFQNIILVMISRALTSNEFTMIAIVKEMYVIAYILIRISKRGKIDKKAAFCIFSIAMIILYWLINGKGKIKGQLTSFRQLYLPFSFYLFGKVCSPKKEDYVDVMRYYVKVCIIAVCFGIFDLILGVRLWSILGLTQYAEVKNNTEHILQGMYRSFYTYDFFGLRLRRMASLLVDPVILGQLLAIGFLVSAFCNGIYHRMYTKYIGTTMIFWGMMATLAKGGMIIGVFSACILLGRIAKKKGLSIFLVALGSIFFVIFINKSIREGLSGSQHINGLVTGFQSLLSNPFGQGIGSGGNMADSYGGYAYRSVAGDESYIGSLMVQMGIIGLALNIALWYKFFCEEKSKNIGRYIIVINTANMILFLTSFINYTAISFNSCFIYLILGAAGTEVIRREQKRSFIDHRSNISSTRSV